MVERDEKHSEEESAHRGHTHVLSPLLSPSPFIPAPSGTHLRASLLLQLHVMRIFRCILVAALDYRAACAPSSAAAPATLAPLLTAGGSGATAPGTSLSLPPNPYRLAPDRGLAAAGTPAWLPWTATATARADLLDVLRLAAPFLDAGPAMFVAAASTAEATPAAGNAGDGDGLSTGSQPPRPAAAAGASAEGAQLWAVLVEDGATLADALLGAYGDALLAEQRGEWGAPVAASEVGGAEAAATGEGEPQSRLMQRLFPQRIRS